MLYLCANMTFLPAWYGKMFEWVRLELKYTIMSHVNQYKFIETDWYSALYCMQVNNATILLFPIWYQKLPHSTADKIQNLKVVAPLSPWEDSQSGEGGGGDLTGGGSAGWGWVGWLGFGLWLAAVASSSKAASKLCWMSRSSSLIKCNRFKVLAIHGFLLCVIILLYRRTGAHYLKGNTLLQIWIMLMMLWNTP